MVETDGDKIRDRNRDRDQRGDDAIKRENNSLIDFVLKNLDLNSFDTNAPVSYHTFRKCSIKNHPNC